MFYFIILFILLAVSFIIYTNSTTISESFANFTIKSSRIDGVGVFTNISLPKDTMIFKCISGKKITKLGQKINHCPRNQANTYLKLHENTDEWYLYALRNIEINEELTSDYNNAPKHLIRPANISWTC